MFTFKWNVGNLYNLDNGCYGKVCLGGNSKKLGVLLLLHPGFIKGMQNPLSLHPLIDIL